MTTVVDVGEPSYLSATRQAHPGLRFEAMTCRWTPTV